MRPSHCLRLVIRFRAGLNADSCRKKKKGRKTRDISDQDLFALSYNTTWASFGFSSHYYNLSQQPTGFVSNSSHQYSPMFQVISLATVIVTRRWPFSLWTDWPCTRSRYWPMDCCLCDSKALCLESRPSWLCTLLVSFVTSGMFTNDHNNVALLSLTGKRKIWQRDLPFSIKQGSLKLLLNIIPIVSHPHRGVLPLLSLTSHQASRKLKRYYFKWQLSVCFTGLRGDRCVLYPISKAKGRSPLF